MHACARMCECVRVRVGPTCGCEEVEVEVGDADAHLLLVNAFQHSLVHVTQNASPVRNDELASLGRVLETDECAVGGCLHVRGLLVESDVVLSERGLVDLFVDAVLLADHLPKAARVNGIETEVQTYVLDTNNTSQ